MAKMIVNHPAGLIMPGGDAPAPYGATVDASEGNAAVAGWIAAGMLVRPKDFAKPVAPIDPGAQAQLDAQAAEIEGLKSQVAKLTEELEAATAAKQDAAKA